MHNLIIKLLNYVENIEPIASGVLAKISELSAWIRQYFVQEPVLDPTPSPMMAKGSNDDFGTLRAWCEDSLAKSNRMPKGAMPAWLLPIFLRLIESVIDKWTRENQPTA